jgi:hypothetical protein
MQTCMLKPGMDSNPYTSRLYRKITWPTEFCTTQLFDAEYIYGSNANKESFFWRTNHVIIFKIHTTDINKKSKQQFSEMKRNKLTNYSQQTIQFHFPPP